MFAAPHGPGTTRACRHGRPCGRPDDSRRVAKTNIQERVAMKNRTTVSGHEHVRARAVVLLALLSIAAALAACGGGKAADAGVGTAPSTSPTGSSPDAASPAASDPNAGAATPPAADAPPPPPPATIITSDYVPLFAAGTPVM